MTTLSGPAAIILDEFPLSLLTSRPDTPPYRAAWDWYAALEVARCRFYVPEIADYELRRELMRAGKVASLRRLDEFNAAEADRYLALTTSDVREAARLWALARNRGRPAGVSRRRCADCGPGPVPAPLLRRDPGDRRHQQCRPSEATDALGALERHPAVT